MLLFSHTHLASNGLNFALYFLEKAPGNDSLNSAINMLKETGARSGEIWQLKWDDVDFESKLVNITAKKTATHE